MRYSQISRLASLVRELGLGFGVGDPVGVGVGLAGGVGVGVGAGIVHAFPSKLLGSVEFDPHASAEYAFEAKAIHFPSLLIWGRLFCISTLMLLGMGGPK